MIIKLENEHGVIKINSEVIALIAGTTAVECYGLAGMAAVSAADEIAGMIMGENLGKGVKITTDEAGNVVVDLYVIVQFGTKISSVAQNIIEKVKAAVEDQTGLKVSMVNLNIEGVKAKA